MFLKGIAISKNNLPKQKQSLFIVLDNLMIPQVCEIFLANILNSVKEDALI